MEEITFIAIVVASVSVAIGVLGLLVWSLMWVYQDAEARGKPGWVVSLLVLLLKWPISLLAWIVFRPELTGTAKKPAPHI